MPKRTPWVFCCAGTLVIGLGAAWFASAPSPLPSVRFSDGKISRVLKVSYGTNHVFTAEPLWKRGLRKVLPTGLQGPLGAPRRFSRATQYDSLAVFMGPDPPHYSTVVQVVFADGTTSQTYWYRASQGPIVFTSYPREEKELRLRFQEKNKNPVEVKIPNPSVARKASWSCRASRQTNHISGNQLIFEPSLFWDGYHWGGTCFKARSLSGGPIGWMQWRTTLFDPWGNWQSGDNGGRPRLPGSKNNKEFRLLAEGQEYISCGFVVSPADHEYVVLPSNQRLTNWGIRFVGLFGRGAYRVSDAFEVQTNNTHPAASADVIKRSESSWLIQAERPALLSIAARPVFELRLRERLERNAGRVFAGRSTVTAIDQQLCAQLFSPRLPAITTNIEAEVVLRWPAVEFFVEKP